MGGKKKLNLKQMERMQDKKDEEDREKRRRKRKVERRKKRELQRWFRQTRKTTKSSQKLKKMHVLTPYAVATRYNIRISAAKDFLEELQQNGTIQLVSGSHNIKIYKAD